MKQISKEYFNKDYFTGGTKSHYGDYSYISSQDLSPHCLEVIRKFAPKRLLDVGCAYGFYVETYRKLGIDAYGVDISDFAISKAPRPVKDYVFVADARSIPFPDQFFDLVVSTDVLEHVPPDDIYKLTSELKRVGKSNYHFVALAQHTDYWKMFPEKDESHVNLQSLEWWGDKFPEATIEGVIYYEKP